MSRRRAIRGVLGNFIATLTSRNADYDGYWIHGLVLAELETMTIDLLEEGAEDDSTPATYLRGLARRSFREQVAHGGLTTEWMKEARLVIVRSPELKPSGHGYHPGTGHEVSFHAQVITEGAVTYESRRSLFVAFHDPQHESRSTRRLQARD